MTETRNELKAGSKVLLFLIPLLLSLSSLALSFASFHAAGRHKEDPHSTVTRQSSISHNGGQCLDFQEGGYLDKLLDEAAVVYMLAVPKAGGSSMGIFINKCMPTRAGLGALGESGVRFRRPSLDTPTTQAFLAKHAWRNVLPYYYFQHSSAKSLFIITYREETDRLGSAIKHVMKHMCQGKNIYSVNQTSLEPMVPLHNRTEGDRVACIINEKEFVEEIIQKKKGELQGSTFEAHSCRYHDSVEENMPNLVMIGMNQLNKLFGLLSRKYSCPLETVHHTNSLAKNWDYYLRIKNGSEVNINEWLKHNLHLLEFNFKMKTDASCQGKTKQMEDQIMACPNEAIYNYYQSFGG